MTVRSAPEVSLRLTRLDSTRLVWALALSLALHGGGWGAYELGKKFHVWENLRVPTWVKALMPLAFKSRPAENKPPVTDREPPLMFVNVTPQQATTEAPKNAKYYSSNNSQAANPDADRDTDTPKISGKQDVVPKTEDVDRNKISKLQPALPAEPQPEERASSKPKNAPGDLTMAKPELNPRTDTGNAEKPRPRTLNEAAARRPLDRIPGQKMKQDGGVKHRLDMSSLDAKATPFGAYDALFIEQVSQRWFDLLANRQYASEARGHVTLQFELHYDGRVTDVKTVEHNVTETLSLMCQKAVMDPAPFEKWPREMRQMIGEDFRKIQFIFYYQ
ncbi:MAG: hypothetical protein EXS35_09025 [Pedosphaera sp.]|nr:hypothetical protein [Pedosphaera sp.]